MGRLLMELGLSRGPWQIGGSFSGPGGGTVYAPALGAGEGNLVRVQIPPRAYFGLGRSIRTSLFPFAYTRKSLTPLNLPG